MERAYREKIHNFVKKGKKYARQGTEYGRDLLSGAKEYLRQHIFEDELAEGTRLLSPEEQEEEMLSFVEEQFGLAEEEDESEEEQQRKVTRLEEELMKKMGIRKDYEHDSIKKQAAHLISQF